MPRVAPVSDVPAEALFRAISFFASECKDFTPQLLKVFLYIASHEGCTVDQVSRGTGVSGSAVSHMTNWLSDKRYKDHVPLGWIVKRQSPIDHRARELHLTRVGLAVLDNLKAIVYPEL